MHCIAIGTYTCNDIHLQMLYAWMASIKKSKGVARRRGRPARSSVESVVEILDNVKDYTEREGHCPHVSQVKNRVQILTQQVDRANNKGAVVTSVTTMAQIIKSVLVGTTKVDKPDDSARTEQRLKARCCRSVANTFCCREHLRCGPCWGLSRYVMYVLLVCVCVV